MMRVADYIAAFLAARGVQHVFLVTGGGAMHLNDAFGRCKAITYVTCHHEQACAMAAESYFRMSGRVAAVNVTTGPGGTNALTGVYGAFVDSIPMFVVSGQVKYETMVASTPLALRQLGDQEVDIVAMARPITKMAALVTEPASIRAALERAWRVMLAGRPGPVWLDIPMNVQGALIDPDALVGDEAPATTAPRLEAACAAVIARIQDAKRPVLFAGNGVRIADRVAAFQALAATLQIPAVTGWNAHDILTHEHPCYAGRPGTIGDRAGNFTVQNADLLVVFGSRLNIRQISYAWQNFARGAALVMIDADPLELQKPTLKVALGIEARLEDFFDALSALTLPAPAPEHQAWLAWCRARVARYPMANETRQVSHTHLNPYHFVDALWAALPDDARVVTGDGTACVVTFQAAALKANQRLYTNSGSAPMGYDLPAAVGAAIATGATVFCLAGDGSIMMNLQELQTIMTFNLPIKIFVLNNNGYHSIRQTQQAYFADNLVGFDPATRVGLPSFEKIAAAFGLGYTRLDPSSLAEGALARFVNAEGPALCEVMLDPAQPFAPKLASRRLDDGRMVSSPLEDMAPFLSREELRENMIIEPLGE
ncbi:MAG: thiamine pyrophosphate-binding protein [Myxococcales bacterium]|nr:thiamine pyrophosphate-binding protein [Myxococcales bacterium]